MKAALPLLWLLAGCSVTWVPGRPTTPREVELEVEERAAMRCIHGSHHDDERDVPEETVDPELEPYLTAFGAEVRRTARAAGIESLLGRLLRERERVAEGTGSSGAVLAMRDELGTRQFALESQLLASEFEVDCVRNLINAVLGEYEEAETDRQLAYTIASLVVGTATTIAASAWDLANTYTDSPAWSDGPVVTGIVGALGTTALGAVVLVPPPQEILYVHEHNLLAPVVNGADPEHLYPPFVFRLLSARGAFDAPSPRDVLVTTFDATIEDAVGEGRVAAARQIVFGVGGIHDVTLLALHQALLEELGAELDGMARDLDMLSGAIAEVLSATAM